MNLPYCEDAQIDPAKLHDYLLSTSHPIGRSKAKFFRGFGFDDDNADLLEDGLLQIARTETVLFVTESRHGVKYVIEGWLQTPAGVAVKVRTVWIIEYAKPYPILVTAYPAASF